MFKGSRGPSTEVARGSAFNLRILVYLVIYDSASMLGDICLRILVYLVIYATGMFKGFRGLSTEVRYGSGFRV